MKYDVIRCYLKHSDKLETQNNFGPLSQYQDIEFSSEIQRRETRTGLLRGPGPSLDLTM